MVGCCSEPTPLVNQFPMQEGAISQVQVQDFEIRLFPLLLTLVGQNIPVRSGLVLSHILGTNSVSRHAPNPIFNRPVFPSRSCTFYLAYSFALFLKVFCSAIFQRISPFLNTVSALSLRAVRTAGPPPLDRAIAFQMILPPAAPPPPLYAFPKFFHLFQPFSFLFVCLRSMQGQVGTLPGPVLILLIAGFSPLFSEKRCRRCVVSFSF